METTPSSRSTFASLALLAILFAGAYGQSPLYSSNQNTYFLTGIARAEGGPLLQDWLVSTTDPNPLFSAYVYSTIKWLSPDFFFLVHTALVAVYALCLMWLVCKTLKLSHLSVSVVVTFVLLTLMHSDFILITLQREFFPRDGAFIFPFEYLSEGLAEQSLLRHFHQPSAFAVLLLVSLCAFLAGRTRTAAVFAGLTPWFHAAFFLPAAVITISYILLELRQERRGQAFLIGLITFGIVLPPLFYTWIHFSPTTAEIAANANRILVRERFPHHSDPRQWFGLYAFLQFAWVIAALVVARRNRSLFTILMAMLAVACTLTLVQVLTRSNTLAMLQPWRLSVLLVPISSALLIATIVHMMLPKATWIARYRRLVLFSSYALMGLLCIAGVASTVSHRNEKHFHPSLLDYVSTQCRPGDTFLIPPDLYRFRLATRYPVFVDWRSHPYRDTEVLEWYERVQLARGFYDAKSGKDAIAALEEIQNLAHITHVVVERDTKLPLEYMKVFNNVEFLGYQKEKTSAHTAPDE
jgi:Domain of unknown function (DUF6798)